MIDTPELSLAKRAKFGKYLFPWRPWLDLREILSRRVLGTPPSAIKYFSSLRTAREGERGDQLLIGLEQLAAHAIVQSLGGTLGQCQRCRPGPIIGAVTGAGQEGT